MQFGRKIAKIVFNCCIRPQSAAQSNQGALFEADLENKETDVTYITERRTEDRQRVLKGGKVFYNNYAISVDCMIRDESAKGMHIKVDPNFVLPSHFSLLNRKDGTLADARVVWKDGSELGIEFSTEMKDVRNFAKADIRRMSIIATRG